MKGLFFTAIDFETATAARSSICEIGIATVADSQVTATRSWLVRPPGNAYAPFNIHLHGITPDMTAEAPDFASVWEELRPFLEGQVVAAHNTSFDMYALRDALDLYGIRYPTFRHYCTRRLAQRCPSLAPCADYRLDTLCRELGIDLETHHRAESDAAGCAGIFIRCMESLGVSSPEELYERYGFRGGEFAAPDRFTPQRSEPSGTRKRTAKELPTGDPTLRDEGSYFYDKTVCFTGTFSLGVRAELQQRIADIGGIPVGSVTVHTDILVVGEQDYRVVGQSGMSSKQKKALMLKSQGHPIEIITEKDFIENS